MAQTEITQMLQAWREGDRSAMERLTEAVYDELHRLAHSYLRREQPDPNLQTTVLVNEAWLRLMGTEQMEWQNRTHFFGIAAQAMRQILVDFARVRQSQKRGGHIVRVTLGAAEQGQERETDLVALDDALQTLAMLDARQSKVVELRFFGGLSLEETAEVLQVSVGTVRRDWRMARAWLHGELARQ